MKQVIKRRAKNAPVVRIKVVESVSGKSVKLSIEILPAHERSSRTAKRKHKTNSDNDTKVVKRYAARPVVGYMNIGQKIVLGRRIYIHMVNNTDFACPSFGLWVLHEITEALDEGYYNALYGEDTDKVILGRREKKFDEIYLEVVEYVDKIADGSAEVYRSAGIEPMLVYQKPAKSAQK